MELVGYEDFEARGHEALASLVVHEFKYFLHSLSFSEDMTDRIVYLEKGEKVVDENGEVLVEG